MRALFPFQDFLNLFEETIWASDYDYLYKDGTLMIEVPGFTKDDLEITIHGRKLIIKGEKEIMGKIYSIDKRFILPDEILNAEDEISAKVENGLLFINFNQSQNNRRKIIKIS